MIKLDFEWYLKNAKNSQTIEKIEYIKKYFDNLNNKKGLVELKQVQKNPLIIGNNKFWLNENNVFQTLHTYFEIFKEHHHTAFNFIKGDENIIIDVGANEGHFILKVRALVKNAIIIAIEPNKEAFDILKKNIKENNIKKCFLLREALSSKNGIQIFEKVKGVTQVGSLHIIGKKWFGNNRIEKIKVKVTTLTSVLKKFDIKKVDILKIDSEGSELDILKGGNPILGDIKKIVVEFHSQHLRRAIISYLVKNGFELLFDEKDNYKDLYFINKRFK